MAGGVVRRIEERARRSALSQSPLGAALRATVREAQFARLHRRGVQTARSFAGRTGLLIQLGSGPKPKPGWINVDLSSQADVTLDLRRPLPFTAGSATMIYCEHFFEHLDHPGPAEQLLRECIRVLEPGGQLSISVPSVEWHLARYVADDRAWFEKERASGQRPDWVRTPLDSLNYLFSMEGEHRFAYDAETLIDRLHVAGFSNVGTRGFDPDLDSEDRRDSLFVDGFRAHAGGSAAS